MKQTIRLTESELRSMIKSTISEALNEIGDTPYGRYMIGRTARRAQEYDDDTVKKQAWEKYYGMQHNDNNNGTSTASDWSQGYNDQTDLQGSVNSLEYYQSPEAKTWGVDYKAPAAEKDVENAKNQIRQNADKKRYDSFQYVRDEKDAETRKQNNAQRIATRDKYRM